MDNRLSELEKLLRQQGYSDELVQRIMAQFNNGQNSDLLSQLLATQNIGSISEEKVFDRDGQEIPFSKTETDTNMGADGEVREKKKETIYNSMGSVAPIVVIDTHNHRIDAMNFYNCSHCLEPCCPKCAILSKDRYSFVTEARHKEHIFCDHCHEPSKDFRNFSDFIITKNELGNIVSVIHKDCTIMSRLIRACFMEEKGKTNGNNNTRKDFRKGFASR